MTRPEIVQQLTTVFREVFDTPVLEIADSTTAANVEGWDSLRHIDLVVAVERQFKVRFTTREVNGMKNVGEFVTLLEKKVGG
jgi:acyl carrier protein